MNMNFEDNTTSFISLLESISQEIKTTLVNKNSDYGDSFHEQYLDYGLTSVLVRLEDKLRRLKTLSKDDSKQKVDESIEDTILDIAGYATLALISLKRR